jgi:hypothetical protein
MQTTRTRGFWKNPKFLFIINNARSRLLAHGAGAALAGIDLVGLGLGNTLGQDLGVLVGLVLDLLGLAPLEGGTVALVLETLGGNQPLDLGGLGVRLLALTLGLDLAADDVLADL